MHSAMKRRTPGSQVLLAGDGRRLRAHPLIYCALGRLRTELRICHLNAYTDIHLMRQGFRPVYTTSICSWGNWHLLKRLPWSVWSQTVFFYVYSTILTCTCRLFLQFGRTITVPVPVRCLNGWGLLRISLGMAQG